MKALEILSWLLQEEQKWGNTQFSIAKYNEAIKELEALESRSCDDCKHYLSDNGNFFTLYPCVECARFYADKFERKEDEN